MNIRKIYNEDIREIILEESGIVSITWAGENERNIIMGIDWTGSQEDMEVPIDIYKNLKTNLHFEFATDIDFNFKHNKTWTIGALEISEFNFKKVAEYKYKIEFIFYFNPVGHLKFNCSNFYFEIIEDQG
jgi:hypothetical protein